MSSSLVIRHYSHIVTCRAMPIIMKRQACRFPCLRNAMLCLARSSAWSSLSSTGAQISPARPFRSHALLGARIWVAAWPRTVQFHLCVRFVAVPACLPLLPRPLPSSSSSLPRLSPHHCCCCCHYCLVYYDSQACGLACAACSIRAAPEKLAVAYRDAH